MKRKGKRRGSARERMQEWADRMVLIAFLVTALTLACLAALVADSLERRG